jgi:hypothetical protein
MAKTALGILTGILIFIAAGILAMYWIGIMRVEKEQKKPRLAQIYEIYEPALHSPRPSARIKIASLGYPKLGCPREKPKS